MSLKRRRSEDPPFQDEPTDLLIITADSEEPIEAHYKGLSLFSRVVDDLPHASNGKTTWDLSKLVLEGQRSPVPSAVVRQWLDLVYSSFDDSRQPPMFPSLSEAARSLLLFADAVGTRGVVRKALVDGLLAQPGLTLHVVVNGSGGGGGAGAAGGAAPPLQLELALALRGQLYYIGGFLHNQIIAVDVPTSDAEHVVVAVSALEPFKAAIPGAVAAALEGWLYLAGRLGMVALVRLLLDFYKAQLLPPNKRCLLQGAVTNIFSRRVLDCMPHELLVEAFVSKCLWDPEVSQVDVAEDVTIPRVALTTPHVATWFDVQPGGEIQDGKMMSTSFSYGGCETTARLSLCGLSPDEQQSALAEVMQRLQDRS